MPVGPQVVDWRFARAVERILEIEFAPGGLQMGVTNIAAGLNVSRATVYGWLNRLHRIKFETVSPFIRDDDWRGFLARCVWEIYDDHERWKMERAVKGTRTMLKRERRRNYI